MAGQGQLMEALADGRVLTGTLEQLGVWVTEPPAWPRDIRRICHGLDSTVVTTN